MTQNEFPIDQRYVKVAVYDLLRKSAVAALIAAIFLTLLVFSPNYSRGQSSIAENSGLSAIGGLYLFLGILLVASVSIFISGRKTVTYSYLQEEYDFELKPDSLILMRGLTPNPIPYVNLDKAYLKQSHLEKSLQLWDVYVRTKDGMNYIVVPGQENDKSQQLVKLISNHMGT